MPVEPKVAKLNGGVKRPCAAITADGSRCGAPAKRSSDFCRWHPKGGVSSRRLDGETGETDEMRVSTEVGRFILNRLRAARIGGEAGIKHLSAWHDELQAAAKKLGADNAIHRYLRDVMKCDPNEEFGSLDMLLTGMLGLFDRVQKADAAGELTSPDDLQEPIRKGIIPGTLFMLYLEALLLLMAALAWVDGEEQPQAAPSNPPRLDHLLKFPSDRIFKGVIEGFMCVPDWKKRGDFACGHTSASRKRDFSMLFGFRDLPRDEIWKFLLSHGEMGIKGHYALWARFYEQTGGDPQPFVINVNQFCEDLGFARHHKGGFKRERKLEAVNLLEVLTSVEIEVNYTPPGGKAPTKKIEGNLWMRGLKGSQRDQYGDLFGQAREGDPDLWDPVGFACVPGLWFWDPVWRRNNQHLGLVGLGLLKLRSDRDQIAIRIGGYLGTLARIGQYRTRRVRVATLLLKTDLAKKYAANPGRLQEKVEIGIEKLREVDVIASWRYTDENPDEPDMDDPDDLATLGGWDRDPWKKRIIEIEWPDNLTEQTLRLEEAQSRQVKRALARRRGKNENAEPSDALGG